jgi:hypothetical protein
VATGRIGTTPVLQVRWSKAPSAGTTSLSGLDDNSVSLVYSVGYEAVYRNGVLLSRTNDYTATNGTTITLIDATIAGDIIEVFANQTIPLSDTYSQTVANGKFINNTLTTTTGDIIYASAANTPARLAIGSTGNVLTVSGGVPAWSAPAGGKVLQVVEGVTTTSTNIATTTLTDTTITATITPSSASSKVLVMVAAKFYAYRGGSTPSEYTVGAVLLRGATIIADYDTTSGDEFNKITLGSNGISIEQRMIQPIIKLDSPATTSAVTYKVQAKVRYTTNSGQVTFQDESTPSTIILMEIGA